jgi:hypothetical protein
LRSVHAPIAERSPAAGWSGTLSIASVDARPGAGGRRRRSGALHIARADRGPVLVAHLGIRARNRATGNRRAGHARGGAAQRRWN